jgi:DNA-binding beta-propeller fold protein YncE
MNPSRESPGLSTGIAIAAALTALSVMMLAGCASAPPPQQEAKMVWPPPPLVTRIQYVTTIVSEKDLSGQAAAGESLAAFLTGEKMPSGRIAEPVGIAVSEDTERLYVADMMQQAVFVFDTKNKKFTKLGNVGVPSGIALDAQENIYVVDSARKTVGIFARDGKQVSEFSDPEFERPNGIAIDKARGRIYVVDTGGRNAKEHNVKIYGLDGRRVGAIGGAPGGDLGQFQYPTYVALDAAGNVYVSDTLNSRVQKFDPDGKFLTTFGQLGTNWGEFDKPKGVAVDSFGNVYVADSGWSNVQIFNPKGQVMLFFGGRGPVPGMMKNPLAVAIDRNNRIYIGDYLNHRIGVYDLVNTTAADSFLTPAAPNPGPKK